MPCFQHFYRFSCVNVNHIHFYVIYRLQIIPFYFKWKFSLLFVCWYNKGCPFLILFWHLKFDPHLWPLLYNALYLAWLLPITCISCITNSYNMMQIVNVHSMQEAWDTTATEDVNPSIAEAEAAKMGPWWYPSWKLLRLNASWIA